MSILRDPLVADSDASAIWHRVNKIDPVIREHSDEAETARRLSQPVVDAMRWAGVFRMAMPAAWGGPELDVCTQVEVIERLARADASAAWCAMIGMESGFFASYIDESAARTLFPELDMISAAFQGPAGRLEACEGGYRLSGRWAFGSAVTHADVIAGGAIVTQDGRPRLSRSGKPEYRVAMLPAEHWEILDTWDPVGLAGSGSHDYAIKNAYVPEEYTFLPGQHQRPEPLYAWYGLLPACGVGVALGVAAEALDNARETLQTKVSKVTSLPAKEDPVVLAGVARAAAMIGASRSYIFDTLGDVFATLQAGNEPSFDQRARWAGAVVHAGTSCRDAVQLLVDAVGAGALHRSSPLQRQLRDLNMVAQHALTTKRVWDWSGALYFGTQPPVAVY
ncbi:acyl-CoA dehydrogenase family protein [Mycobacterium sp. 1245499.0]|uniref:acyl-CoA dehydrogenase family protein n=1 Tax=Mycobacterium sp. 1245499.0 TaxID=1834074 RepID=UPI0009F364AF|nr:acyl-CoA dehydrogenase family protein [Mycobacterium sp. 1245499.0]